MTTLRTNPCPSDPVFDQEGPFRYQGLSDGLFGVPGRWNIRANDGLFWLDPMPVPDDIMRAYVSYHTHDDDAPDPEAAPARAGWYHALRERVWSALRESADSGRSARMPWQASIPPVREQLAFDRAFLRPIPGGRLLDVGSGAGELVDRLDRLGWEAQGIDPDHRAVQQAVSMGRSVTCAGVESLDELPDGFDVVTMIHVIEHVYEPLEVLRSVHGRLKPNGRVLIVTPNAGSMCSRLFGRYWRGLEPPRHLQIFKKHALADALSKTGFRNIRVRTSFRDASGMFCASYALWRSGRHRQGAIPRRGVRIVCDVVLMIEWLLTRLGLPVGEELVAIAERD